MRIVLYLQFGEASFLVFQSNRACEHSMGFCVACGYACERCQGSRDAKRVLSGWFASSQVVFDECAGFYRVLFVVVQSDESFRRWIPDVIPIRCRHINVL